MNFNTPLTNLSAPVSAQMGASWLTDEVFLLPNWKWIIAFASLILGALIQKVSLRLLRSLKNHYVQHPKLPALVKFWLKEDLQSPLSWLIAALIWHIGVQAISVHILVEKLLTIGLHLILLLNLMRLAYMAVAGFGHALEDGVKNSNGRLDSQLAPFATKVLRIVVVTLGFLLSLQSLGFNVGAVLAGLGIGSLALALAAQDTAANLFGSITIILDKPFQIGDYIKVGDTEGTVEEVGFRSTQIRTGYKSLITVPNSSMAKERVDNLGARNSRRLKLTLSAHAQSSPESLQSLVIQLRQHLQNHQHLVPGENSVFITGLGEFNIKIDVVCFVNTRDAGVEAQTQQDLILDILNLSRKAGVELAYPTQTLHLASLPRSQPLV